MISVLSVGLTVLKLNQIVDSLIIKLMESVLEFLSDHAVLLTIIGLIGSYLTYYLIFSYFICPFIGNYDTTKKNLGKTLPPYPNGWYVACKAKQLPPNATKNIQLSGHNIVLFRSSKGQVYALHAYCAHMGANLGVGGQVVNQTCVQCPFHGWLFDGETGRCVDHDKKPLMLNSIEYGDDFGCKDHKQVKWKEGKKENPRQRKYRTYQQSGFVYVWIHSDPDREPYFMPLNNEEWTKKWSNRGHTLHHINCHVQDIPENGADTFHFRYVHKYLIGRYKMMQVSWTPQWMRGDDPDLPSLFEHRFKGVRAFKQDIYNRIIKPIENKQYYSFGNADNFLHLPLIGPVFLFNITIIQMGPGLVNVYFKTHFFEMVFLQYVQSDAKFKHRLYHQMYCSQWLPYWLTSIMLYGEGMQVYYDMMVWDAKRVSYKLFYKKNDADRFIRSWRTWFSQHYEGCDKQLQAGVNDW